MLDRINAAQKGQLIHRSPPPPIDSVVRLSWIQKSSPLLRVGYHKVDVERRSIFLHLNTRSKKNRSGLSAAGQLRGLHNLDTCDPHLGPAQDYPEASSSRDFPSTECCSNFLDTHLEGWRRLDCGKSPVLSLSDLPQGLAVLSLQARNSRKPERSKRGISRSLCPLKRRVSFRLHRPHLHTGRVYETLPFLITYVCRSAYIRCPRTGQLCTPRDTAP